MGWLQLVGPIKLQVSFAKEPYKRDDILLKRHVILSILLTVATPYTENPSEHRMSRGSFCEGFSVQVVKILFTVTDATLYDTCNRMCVHIYVWAVYIERVCIYRYTYIHTYTYPYIQTYPYICSFVSSTHTHTHTHTHTGTQVHTHPPTIYIHTTQPIISMLYAYTPLYMHTHVFSYVQVSFIGLFYRSLLQVSFIGLFYRSLLQVSFIGPFPYVKCCISSYLHVHHSICIHMYMFAYTYNISLSRRP